MTTRKKETSSHANKEIGERIRYLREDLLEISTQTEFAEPLHVSRGAVGNWELGKGIKRANLQLIAEVYSVSLNWLLTGKGTAMVGTLDPIQYTAQTAALELPMSDYDDFVADIKALLEARIERVKQRRRDDNSKK